MAKPTVLVTGATGLLGREVMNAFRFKGWDVKGTGYSRADGTEVLKTDIGDQTEVAKLFDQVNPRAVIHCAAQRFPDKVDKDPEGAKSLNVSASAYIAKEAATRDVLLVHISTDYVFPGVPGESPYEADASPRPTNLYGETKLDGEKEVLQEYAKAGKEGSAVVLRVPVLYGHAEMPAESAVNVLMDSVWKTQTEGTKIKMDHWALRYPTCTEDVGRVCHDVAVKYLESSDRKSLPQVLQFSSEDKVTKYEICQRFGDIMGLAITGIEPNTEGNDPSATVQRPYDTHLSTKSLKDLGISVSTVKFVDWWKRELGAFRK